MSRTPSFSSPSKLGTTEGVAMSPKLPVPTDRYGFIESNHSVRTGLTRPSPTTPRRDLSFDFFPNALKEVEVPIGTFSSHSSAVSPQEAESKRPGQHNNDQQSGALWSDAQANDYPYLLAAVAGVCRAGTNAVQAIDHTVRQRAYRRIAKMSRIQKKSHDLAVRLEFMRTQKWRTMLADWDKFYRKHPGKVKKRCRKGIPDAVRSMAWMRITGAYSRKEQNPSLYTGLLRRDVTDPETIELFEVIHRDISRTFTKHHLFSEPGGIGQYSLLRVLRAYALYNPKVGYCQGMAFLAAVFLSYMPEEDAFFALLSLMNCPPYHMEGLFSEGMVKVRMLCSQFEEILKQFMPKLSAHFARLHVDANIYAAQWFITIFSYNFPFEIVVRVWDTFLIEGWKVVFRCGLAMLQMVEEELLHSDFEGIMSCLRVLPDQVDVEDLMKVSFKISLKRKQLRAAEALFLSRENGEQ